MRNYIALIFIQTLFLTFVSAQEVIPPEQLRAKQLHSSDKMFLIDVRHAADFIVARILGAVNMPLEIIKTTEIPFDKTLILYCSGETCPLSDKAAKILIERGCKDVKILGGGLATWKSKGYPIIGSSVSKNTIKEKVITKIPPKKALSKIKKGQVLVVDVRPEPEFEAGHLPDAVNMPLESISSRISYIQTEKEIIVCDRISTRSIEAAKILAGNGFKVRELSGGLAVWAALKYPMELGVK